MKLFYLNPKTELIELHKEELRLIPEFRKILERDKGSGSKRKLNALKEFTFLYLYTDWDSPYVSLNDKERYDKSIKDAGLIKGWFIDDVINKAIDKYKELQVVSSPDVDIVNNLVKGLQTSNTFISQLISIIQNDMNHVVKAQEVYDKTDFKNENDKEDAFNALMASRTTHIGNISKNIKELIEYSKTIPASIKSLKQFENNVREDVGDQSRVVVGGGEVYNREDPSYLNRLEKLNIDTQNTL